MSPLASQCILLMHSKRSQWEKTFNTNIHSFFYLSKYVLPHMKEGSTIINCASVNPYIGRGDLLDYTSTKGAIVAFTRGLSNQQIKKGIRVNCVCPGPSKFSKYYPKSNANKTSLDAPDSCNNANRGHGTIPRSADWSTWSTQRSRNMFRFPRKPAQQLYFGTVSASQRRYDGQWIRGAAKNQFCCTGVSNCIDWNPQHSKRPDSP
jgi:NAD(P)-dependent dehydrogenase (short-subunit alcohol dehydrogenase family)